jgi:hypothetical protein
VLHVRDVHVAHVDAAPLQAAERLAREDVERTRQDDEVRARLLHVPVEALERRVDARPDLDEGRVEQAVDQVRVAAGTGGPALEAVRNRYGSSSQRTETRRGAQCADSSRAGRPHCFSV